MNSNESMGSELQPQESSEPISESIENSNSTQPIGSKNREEDKKDLFVPILPQKEADELRNLRMKTGAGTATDEEKNQLIVLENKEDALLKVKTSEPNLNNLTPAEKQEVEELNRMQTSGKGWGKGAYQRRQELFGIARKRGIQ